VGNFYVLTTQDVESVSNKIRKVTPAGLVTTVTKLQNPENYGFNGNETMGDQWVAQSKMTLGSAGNIYVGYSKNNSDVVSVINQIAKVTPNGVSTTFAGSGDSGSSVDGQGTLARFGGIYSLAADSSSNIFVNENQRIRKVTSNGSVTTLAGQTSAQLDENGNIIQNNLTNGSGFSFSFQSIRAMKVDGSGNLYVVDGTGDGTGDEYFKVIKISPQ
jgi:hypothetical protein